MMSGMPLETCWDFNKLWNSGFCYRVASCLLFLLIHTTMHGSWILDLWLHGAQLHGAELHEMLFLYAFSAFPICILCFCFSYMHFLLFLYAFIAFPICIYWFSYIRFVLLLFLYAFSAFPICILCFCFSYMHSVLLLYAFCFNLYCGGFILFCNVCMCVCGFGRVCVCVCVCVFVRVL
jgi:hypothetical protein